LAVLSILLVWLFQVGVVVSTARLQMSRRNALILFLVGTALFCLSLVIKVKSPALRFALVTGRDLSLMLAAVPFGYLVSFIIKEPNILVPVALVAGIVDFWNVMVGPLGKVVEKHPAIVDKVSVHVPSVVRGLPAPTIGMGDIVFLAMFFGVVYRFGMNAKSAFWLGYILLAVSLFAVLIFPIAIPALVPMGIAIVISNFNRFKLKRDEILATVIVSVFVAALLSVFTLFMRKM
ncbi:MAG TPA: hypothetical protein VGK34_08775, partial [Armatimonadota bacterium]